jgi:hypothetical protein
VGRTVGASTQASLGKQSRIDGGGAQDLKKLWDIDAPCFQIIRVFDNDMWHW